MPFSAPADEVASEKGFSAPDDEVIQPEKKESSFKETVSKYARPALEFGGGLAGGALGIGAGAPTVAGVPVGGAVGFGLGTAAGKSAADLLDEYLGLRESPTPKEAVKQTGKDIVNGLVIGATGELVPPVIENYLKPASKTVGDLTRWLGKKGIESVLGPSGEAIEARLANPEMIKNAIPSQAIAEKLPGTLSKLQEQVSKYDKAAWETLSKSHDPLEGAIPKDKILGEIDKLKNDFRITGGGTAGEADSRAVSKLDAIKQRIIDLGQNVKGRIQSEQGVPSILKNKDFISERNLKEIIQSYDKDINYNDVMAGQTNKAISNVRQTVDDLLKTQNTAYKKAMAPVAERVSLLEDLPKSFNLQRELDGSFSPGNKTATNLETAGKEKALASRDALERLKKLTGEDYLKDIKSAEMAKQFKGGVTQGSRRSTPMSGAGAAVLGGIGGLTLGTPGAVVGGAVGSIGGGLAGMYLDTEGREVAGNLIDWYVNKQPSKLGKYAVILGEAAKKGAQYLGAIHGALHDADPQYRKIVDRLEIPRGFRQINLPAAMEAAKAYDSGGDQAKAGGAPPLSPKWNEAGAEPFPQRPPTALAMTPPVQLEPPPPPNMDAYHAVYRKAVESFINGDNKTARRLAQEARKVNPGGREAKELDERLGMKGF